MTRKISGCSAELCPYRDTCLRHKIYQDKPRHEDNVFADYSVGCNNKTGFDSYIPITRT